MISITSKTLQDLEFDTILQTISSGCNTDLGKEKALQIVPFNEKNNLMDNLTQTSEYLSSFTNNNAIANHGFDTINYELKFLIIDDSQLELNGFRKILNLSDFLEDIPIMLLYTTFGLEN